MPWLDEITVSKIDILVKDYKKKLFCSMTDAGPWHNMPKDEVEAALKKIRNNEFPSSSGLPNVLKETVIGQKA
ncbi:hypothetical protein M422DRAFT_272135 [Sphaerobolus stellatus SS14]|uniref:Uncharacterized protein n=1 Tax=Sphaerobolus stellatus (strain SS14) TaxID=990650 RepID=A0A0C9UMU1_SPHS4|nr:hypothetical protein M422DRAFT_272135 [Sphaerobolus stellatus SS14]